LEETPSQEDQEIVELMRHWENLQIRGEIDGAEMQDYLNFEDQVMAGKFCFSFKILIFRWTNTRKLQFESRRVSWYTLKNYMKTVRENTSKNIEAFE
jgi:hypothetical protein